ncbi:hypothetical protein PVAND_000346 [Polypedilum vanderplanki]|uniref:Apyrase n=1 Tax=Polypedilum vanderplanki TaxID=319348 RepID=A0A9J6BJQ4_POLVA|nr:hypothetical protein PVAND_000346 [Polypedilum vanderplanki]
MFPDHSRNHIEGPVDIDALCTLWYTLFKWNVTQYLLNLEPADVMTIGNHEFDHGIDGLVPFLDHIKTPVVVCNFDDSSEPKMQGKYTKSIVLEKNGKKIGVVGVTTTLATGNRGKLKILPEVENVKKEVDNLVEKRIKIIIVLSHSGLEVDREIAKHGGDIDIIVGGHSHSFLYSGTPSIGPDTPVSDYPTIEEQENGRKVLIVQASAYAKYLGNITLYFDEDGEIKHYEGAPIFLSHDIEQDPEIINKLKPWKEELDKYQSMKIGSINFSLDFSCLEQECGIGNLITDAMVDSFVNAADSGEWTAASIALLNSRGIRSTLSRGDINYADLVSVLPFENYYNIIEIPGSTLREALEFSVSNSSTLAIFQVSGIKVTFDLKRKPYDRIVELKVLCQDCLMPKYEDIDKSKDYRVVISNYIAEGGDGYTMFPAATSYTVIGMRDIDVLSEYIKKYSPITKPLIQSRIKFL